MRLFLAKLILYIIFFCLLIYKTENTIESANVSIFLSLNIEDNYLSTKKIYILKPDYNLQFFNKCTIKICFNISNCQFSNFNIFVYDNPIVYQTKLFKNIIQILSNLSFSTHLFYNACLNIPSIDTIDRDILSRTYVKNIDKLLNKIQFTNHVKNHLFFNFYSGTWPYYSDDNFLQSFSFFAKSSFNQQTYAKNYDISFPLLNNESISLIFRSKKNYEFSASKRYLASFKGKRYLSGYGSDTRNSLFHISNNNDVIILTTCRHGTYTDHFNYAVCYIEEKKYKRFYFYLFIYL